MKSAALRPSASVPKSRRFTRFRRLAIEYVLRPWRSMGSMLAMSSGDFSTGRGACHDPSAHGPLPDQRPPDFHHPADKKPPVDEPERLRLLLPKELVFRDGDLVPLLVAVNGVARRFGEFQLLLQHPVVPGVSL